MADTVNKQMTIILKLSDEVQEWLAREGEPHDRKAYQQATWLCKRYLAGAYERATATMKNGKPRAPVED